MDRRQAKQDYKMKKALRGVYAVRCTATGSVWIGSFGDLHSIQSSIWFQLRGGLHFNKPMQAEWNQHGEASFVFGILETFEDDLLPISLKDVSKDRQSHWQQELSAPAI